MASDGSKYVRETGPGYESIVRVSDGAASLCLNTIDAADWPVETIVGFLDDPKGVRVLPVAELPPAADVIDAETNVYRERNSGRRITVPMPPIRALDVANGEDLRVYSDDKPGLLLVNAAADPLVDGGERA